MTSQPVQQTITINVVSCISGSKVSQTVRFDQSIEYNMRKIIHKK